VASTRTGKKIGPARVRRKAMSSPNTRIPSAATTSTRTFSQSPDSTVGSEAHAVAGLKKVCCTRGQPGACARPKPMATANTSVDPSATSVERRARDRR
jgi:hypothetical protein